MIGPESSPYRQLPSVDQLLAEDQVQALFEDHGASIATDIARASLEAARRAISDGHPAPTIKALASDVYSRAINLLRPRPRPVINATGVIIHTNLGRAPLSSTAQLAALTVSRGYSDLEFNLEAGERGSRHVHPEELLRQIVGSEAAIVVNNNASAVLLALYTLASGREVIVSRGEAVEIGGRFRIPDVLRQSGCVLVEVGTTNRTYLEDYEEAITERTAAILKVHKSNFSIIGFTHTTEPAELVEVAHRHGILLLNDLGSGCLIDTTKYGLASEPTVQESVAAGVDLSLFSGDKLLGGPQAGVAVGTKGVVDQMKAHPLARAVRIDKLDLAALTATLVPYITGHVEQEIPVWRMISTSREELGRRASTWADLLGEGFEVVDGESAIGGGSLPGQTVPTQLLSIPVERSGKEGLEGLSARLRQGDPAIVARITDNRLLLDPRTVLPEEDELVGRLLWEAINYI